MNFYGDFRNIRTEIRQKKVISKKKNNLRIFQDPIKNSLSDYIILKTLFSEKTRQIKKIFILAFIWS